jgi:hypothetical protein
MSKEGNYSAFFSLLFGINSGASLFNVERFLLSDGYFSDVLLSSITGVF